MIYFIEAVGTDRVKIGSARNVVDEFDKLRRDAPVELKILKVIDGGRHEEKTLHERFAEHRVHFEWFELEPLRSFIERLPTEELRRPWSTKEIREGRSTYSQRHKSATTDEERASVKEEWREWSKGELLVEGRPRTPREALLKMFEEH